VRRGGALCKKFVDSRRRSHLAWPIPSYNRDLIIDYGLEIMYNLEFLYNFIFPLHCIVKVRR